MRTTFAEENSENGAIDTVLTQETPESEEGIKFPMKIKYRGRVLAKLYRPSDSYPSYRVAWTAGGRRMMKAFPRYGEAKRHADKLVKDLAKGSQVTALTPGQANDALAAFARLQRHYEETGCRVSLLEATSEYAGNIVKLPNGRTISEAVDGFLSTVASVKRKDVAEAVEEFIAADEPRTKASDGKRAQLSAKYAYNRAIMLRRFASVFPNNALCDLGKQHVDTFFASLGNLKSKSRNHRPAVSAKSRNHHRNAVRQFLSWAVRHDYLQAMHRLNEADGMRLENGNTAETEFYSPAEFNALLDKAEGPMRAMIALGGLAGLRTAELLRLTWEDTRRVEGHIEITSGKAKTRQRRLVEIVPSLALWLAPFAELTGKIWAGHEVTFQQHFCDLCNQAEHEIKGHKVKVPRKANGLRHSYCTYHLALNGNENATALQAGNSPQMLHQHYRGLATKKEAEAWFAVAPVQPGNVIALVPVAKK